jgi:DNA-binding IclR family transcriptional regulator
LSAEMDTSKALPGAQSLQRAIILLRAVARHNAHGAHLSNLAREVNLHPATARRLLSALSAEGFTSFDPISKLYKLGITLYHLGSVANQFAVREQFHSILEKIAEETEDTVFLLIRSGNDCMCVDRIEGKFPIRALTIDVGVSRPLGVGVGSLALIAFLPRNDFEKVVTANAQRYKSFDRLEAGIIRNTAKKSQKRGFVLSEGLFWAGVTSIGVPVFGESREVIAAITVTAISSRMTRERQRKVAETIMRYAGPSTPVGL